MEYTADELMEVIHNVESEVIKHYGDGDIEFCDITEVLSVQGLLFDDDITEDIIDHVVELLEEDGYQVIYESGKKIF